MFDRSHGTRFRLLVVDDDADIREQLAEIFEAHDFDVDVAIDGNDAIAILRARPSFDLILLDLMMPKADGWQFRVAQRADPMLSSVPVIAMSASTSAHAKAIDADAYVSKPFDPDALVEAVRHVLEKRRSSQTDRLASLGRMAAGISHEVNNPLTYIYASLAMAETALATARSKAPREPDAAVSEITGAAASIHRALEGLDRVRSIMSGVRVLIQAPDERQSPIDVRDVIEGSLAVLSGEIEAKTRIETTLDEVPIVSGNAGQLSQLVVNLVTNALDSIPEGDADRHCLTIRTRTSDNDAVIEVEDTGAGMSEDVRDRIFEPFFTTKPPGVGTGLGLSICHGIARSHGGSIEVESEPARGSCFRVRLPGSYATEGSPPRSIARRAKLLIVEDDSYVADALARIFGQDYETTVVHDGNAALKILEHGGPRPDIILCDMFLGAMTGEDIYRKFSQAHPQFRDRMVFMTGAAFTGSSRRFLDEIPNPCLNKPFTPAEFEKALERLPSRLRAASRTRLRAASDEALSQPSGRTRNRPPSGTSQRRR